MPRFLLPVEKNNLSDLAYQSLKQALLSGRFQPGERLVLRDVAADLQISLTPVRDAINHLIAERVLDRGPGGQKGGATVPRLDAEQFRQLMLLRADLESRLAEAAARHIDPDEIGLLQQTVEKMREAIDRPNKNTYLDMHRRFHFSLYAHARMDVVLDITETLWLRCGPALNAVLSDYVPNLKRRDYHGEAVEWLRKGDPAKVAESIRRDVTEASAYISRQLEKEGRDGE
ncbi:GntR family transcriptional regulator [Paracandidimonas soli]|uniref:GntR family transcriptional regulator n=1 Tax=Paracandidimonas soli TaxID=1917182 RepID=UPI0033423DC6